VYFFFFRLYLKAGAKVENLFLTGKCFLKFFFKKISFPFSLLNPASLSMNFPRFAGCKCNIRFLIPQAFLNLFLKKISNLNSKCMPVYQGTFVVVAGAKVPPLFTSARVFIV